MTNHNDIFSFSGSGTDDIESILYDCRCALMTVRHVCDAPDNHEPPEPVRRGCAFILDGVLATLDSVEDNFEARAREQYENGHKQGLADSLIKANEAKVAKASAELAPGHWAREVSGHR